MNQEEINKKARELICKFNIFDLDKNKSKQCALTACDEILKYIDSKGNGYYTLSDELRADYDEQLAIKQAIENL